MSKFNIGDKVEMEFLKGIWLVTEIEDDVVTVVSEINNTEIIVSPEYLKHV